MITLEKNNILIIATFIDATLLKSKIDTVKLWLHVIWYVRNMEVKGEIKLLKLKKLKMYLFFFPQTFDQILGLKTNQFC